MELSQPPKANYATAFIVAGLFFLCAALLFGLAAALEYIIPGLWRDIFSFEKLRPLHVSSAMFWILSATVGSVFTFFQQHNARQNKRNYLVKWQFFIFTATFGAILISYCFSIFGGREYWEFHPYFSIPIITGWLLFVIWFFSNIKTLKGQPVYIWMWLTGILFFLFTYIESNLWLIPGVRNHLVKDMTIQWKSYGSLVGSWNMLIYGSSIYLMDRIGGNKKYSNSNIAFALYFLGLFNLMFNWGHHIYTLPVQPYVKHIGYAVSMTEILLFGRIIYLWKSSVTAALKNFHIRSYRFLIAADVWIFLTLGLAIAMSVPALNLYMHGTHIVVAHTMGATIGINSMLLLAFAYDSIGNDNTGNDKAANHGYRLATISLFVFWVALIAAGVLKSNWQFNQPGVSYGEMMKTLRPCFIIFFIAGCGLTAGLFMTLYSLIRNKKTTPLQ